MFKSHPLRLVLVITLHALLTQSAQAAVRFWDGGGTTGFWDTAANWSNNVAPANGDALFFPTNVARLVNTNRSAGNLTNISTIRFTGDGYSVFSVPFINLTNGMTNAGFVNSANTLNAGLNLRGNQTWAVGGRNTLTANSNVVWSGSSLTNDLDGSLIMNGIFNGGTGAQLIKLGAGRLELNGTPNSVPAVRVIEGSLQVDGTLTAAISFVISNGASLTGTGSVSPFSCAGDFSPGRISAPGLLTMTGAGSADFATGARFFANLDGIVPGTSHDQFRTPTSPNLSGATLLILRSFSFPFALGQKFVIITNTGVAAQSSTFANLAQNARVTNNGVVFQISYAGGSGNDVELTVVDAPLIPTGVTRTWDGGGANALFSTAANWVGDVVPQEGDSILFPTGLSTANSLATNNLAIRFHQLLCASNGAGMTLRGQPLLLAGGILATQASGALTVFNDVSFIGPADVQTAGGNVLLRGSVTNGGNDLTISGGAGRVEIFGVLSGAGGLVVDSVGGAQLNNGNLYQGTTRLLGGPVLIGAPGALGEGTSAPTFIGEGVVVSVTATRLVESSIVLTGRLAFSAPSTTDVFTAFEFAGPDASVLAGPSAQVQFFGPWSGSGAVQLDQGDFILGSTHAVVGGITAANRGRFFANGSGDSDVILGSSNGNLGGTGQVGRVTVAFGRGRVAPGNSPGILTTSNLLFTGVTTNTFELNGLTPGSGHDQIRVHGTVTLSGTRLEVTTGFTPATGDTFTLIDNDGADAVIDTCVGLPEGALLAGGAQVFRISYVGGTGNDVVLTALDIPIVPTGVTRVWDGEGGLANRNMNTAVNWLGNVLPNRGDDLVFPSSVASNLRILQNNIPATNALYNRIWFGGEGNPWNLHGNALKILGGVVATNEGSLGHASFGNANVELIGSQTWSSTNVSLVANAPLILNGHTLTLAAEASSQIAVQDRMLGPGSVVAVSGGISFFNDLGASDVAMIIQGGRVFAGFGTFTGPAWQMSGGVLQPGFASIPGLQLTGGTLDFSSGFSIANATIAGHLTLAPAASVFAQFDSPTNTPLVVTGQVNLAGARLNAGFTDLALLGTTLKLIEKTSAGAVTGTFTGLAEGAFVNGTNEFNGLVTRYRISYVGGDGNDITLTPVAPTPSGFARTWTGAGADALWPTVANWTGNTPPANGDTALFPVNAARRANTNTSPGLILDTLEWRGSNYVHSGTLSLLSGLRHGAAGGTNAIINALVVAYGENTWAVSNAAATLRVVREDNGEDGRIEGLGPVTKTGAGTLELEKVAFDASGGFIAGGGTTRLIDMDFINGAPLFVRGGRVEAVGVSTEFLTATNGELALLFAPLEGEPGDVFGGLSAFGGMTLDSNLTVTLHWTNGAPAGLRGYQLDLGHARLDVTAPAGLPSDETILVAQYDSGGLAGQFANLPEGAVTNFAGRDWEIRYAVEIPDAPPGTRFITLSSPRIAPRFTSIERLGNGDVVLRGIAGPGATVNIEGSKLLEAFVGIGSSVANGAGQFTFIETAPAETTRFYRAALP